ncbi:MAG: caspase family protein, partial [Rhodospirillaceae bacterium]|nr:caspase family protein [Rhodospirillaceae bacterium]
MKGALFFPPVRYPNILSPARLICALLVLLLPACAKTINLPSQAAFVDGAPQRFSFSGTYDTTWGDLRFSQVGSRMTGNGGGFNFTGSTDGNSLEGNYGNAIIQGQFYFLMSEDGKSLKGNFSNNMGDGGEWLGIRKGQPIALKTPDRQTAQQDTQVSRQSAGLARQKAEIERLKQEREIARLKAATESDRTKRAGPNFPMSPVDVNYVRAKPSLDDIAVIIGNANYTKLGKDIPDVTPAYADAAGFKRYAVEALGIREGNIIDLKDASSAQLVRVFGSEKDHRGQLYDWTKPGESRVFVYYAGHGAPATGDGSAYIVPADADGSRIQLNGYPLSVLYNNLSKVPAKSMTVVLEACFSGAAQGGAVISNASPVFAKATAPPVPANITVIAAGGANQMASWEKDKSSGLFTKYFLKGMSGEADTAKTGN